MILQKSALSNNFIKIFLKRTMDEIPKEPSLLKYLDKLQITEEKKEDLRKYQKYLYKCTDFEKFYFYN